MLVLSGHQLEIERSRSAGLGDMDEQMRRGVVCAANTQDTCGRHRAERTVETGRGLTFGFEIAVTDRSGDEVWKCT